jgi:uncharacterized membrane protein AbrB (regulator of aidB expression)
MLLALPPRRTLFEITETLAIALAGALAFALLGLPAGLVSGSVLAVTAAALLGRPVKMPLAFVRVCYIVVGILLGSVVTPETLRGVTTWPASIALLILASLGMMFATSAYLRVVHRWDPRHCHRADGAGFAAGGWIAERLGAVRAGRAGGGGRTGSSRRFRAG